MWLTVNHNISNTSGEWVRCWKHIARAIELGSCQSDLCNSWGYESLRKSKDLLKGAGQNIPRQNIPCHFLTPRTKHPTKICHPGQNIPCCFCHPGHNIPCCFCHPGHNIPCSVCHPRQNIPHSDCFYKVSLIWDLHLLLHVLAVNCLVRLSKC